MNIISKTSIMKAVVLVVVLLVTAGCHARSLQADAPSQLKHFQAAFTVYLSQVREQAMKSLKELEGPDYEQYKQKLTESLDQLQKYTDQAGSTLNPIATQIMESTKGVRQHILSELEDLHTQLEPHHVHLKQVVEKHLDEYRAKLGPIFQDYMSDNQKELDGLQARLQPALEELREKVEVNFEETKSKMLPLVETVRAKLTKQLEDLRNLAMPVAEEYKEYVMKSMEEARSQLAPHTTDLQGQLEPFLQNLKAKLTETYEALAEALKA